MWRGVMNDANMDVGRPVVMAPGEQNPALKVVDRGLKTDSAA